MSDLRREAARQDAEAKALEDALVAYGRRTVEDLFDHTAVARVTSWHIANAYGEHEAFALIDYLKPDGADEVLFLHATDMDVADEGDRATPEGLRTTFAEIYLRAADAKHLRDALRPEAT